MCLELIQFAVASHSASRRERRTFEIARDLAARLGPEGQLYIATARGLALYMRGRFPEALGDLDAVEAETRRAPTFALHRTGTAATNVRLFAICSCFFSGKLREEARRARLLLREVEDRGDVYTAVCLRLTVMVDICLSEDDPDAARRSLREGMAGWTQSGFHVQHWYAMFSEVHIELYLGDGASARARVERDARDLERSFLLHSRFIRGFTAFARGSSAVASADADPSKRTARVREARRLARQLEGASAPWSETLGSLVRAAAANVDGERAEAVGALRCAVENAAAAGMLLHGWTARHRLGLLIGGAEGSALVLEAEQAMLAEGVRAPARMAGMLLPGRWTKAQ
jgi:hypothetical protein